jgi:hypothetical protein
MKDGTVSVSPYHAAFIAMMTSTCSALIASGRYSGDGGTPVRVQPGIEHLSGVDPLLQTF